MPYGKEFSLQLLDMQKAEERAWQQQQASEQADREQKQAERAREQRAADEEAARAQRAFDEEAARLQIEASRDQQALLDQQLRANLFEQQLQREEQQRQRDHELALAQLNIATP